MVYVTSNPCYPKGGNMKFHNPDDNEDLRVKPRIVTKKGFSVAQKSSKPSPKFEDKPEPERAFYQFLDSVEKEKERITKELKDVRQLEGMQRVIIGELREEINKKNQELKASQHSIMTYSHECQTLREENIILKKQVASSLEFQELQKVAIETIKRKYESKSEESSGEKPKLILSEEEMDFSCPVCMMDFGEKLAPLVWDCGHVVCQYCTETLGECPICRTVKTSVTKKCHDYLRLLELIQKSTSN